MPMITTLERFERYVRGMEAGERKSAAHETWKAAESTSPGHVEKGNRGASVEGKICGAL